MEWGTLHLYSILRRGSSLWVNPELRTYVHQNNKKHYFEGKVYELKKDWKQGQALLECYQA